MTFGGAFQKTPACRGMPANEDPKSTLQFAYRGGARPAALPGTDAPNTKYGRQLSGVPGYTVGRARSPQAPPLPTRTAG